MDVNVLKNLDSGEQPDLQFGAFYDAIHGQRVAMIPYQTSNTKNAIINTVKKRIRDYNQGNMTVLSTLQVLDTQDLMEAILGIVYQ